MNGWLLANAAEGGYPVTDAVWFDQLLGFLFPQKCLGEYSCFLLSSFSFDFLRFLVSILSPPPNLDAIALP
jgi:hypothetical protein